MKPPATHRYAIGDRVLFQHEDATVTEPARIIGWTEGDWYDVDAQGEKFEEVPASQVHADPWTGRPVRAPEYLAGLASNTPVLLSGEEPFGPIENLLNGLPQRRYTWTYQGDDPLSVFAPTEEGRAQLPRIFTRHPIANPRGEFLAYLWCTDGPPEAKDVAYVQRYAPEIYQFE